MPFDIRSFIDEVAEPEYEPEEITELIDGSEIEEEATQRSVTSYLQKFDDSRVGRFLRLSAGLSKTEKRKLEQDLLKPDSLPAFIGTRPARSVVEERTVKMIFETDESIELFKRFFRVNNYKGQNTRDVDIIVALIEALDRGSI